MCSYIKKSLFSFLILMMPYMNPATKAMNAEEHVGSTVRARNIDFVKDEPKDNQSLTKKSVSSQVVSLENYQNSWTSYLSSSVKAVAKNGYYILDCAARHPKSTLVVCALLSMSVTPVVRAAMCVCSNCEYDSCPNGWDQEIPDCIDCTKGLCTSFCIAGGMSMPCACID